MLLDAIKAPLTKVKTLSRGVDTNLPTREAELDSLPQADHAVVLFGSSNPSELRARVAKAAQALDEDRRHRHHLGLTAGGRRLRGRAGQGAAHGAP